MAFGLGGQPFGLALLNSPSSAFGRAPAGPSVSTTAGPNTSTAIATGNQVYGQLPGYAQSLSNVGGNIQSETAGEVPEDVKRAIAQGAAERGVSTGNVGGANTNADYLRALGLTSLDLTGRGQQNLQGILPVLPGAQISQNPGFYVNPGQQYEADLQRSLFNAAPNPAAAGRVGLNAVGSGYSAGLGSGGGFGLPQMGFGGGGVTGSSGSTAGPFESAPVVGRGTGQLGTSIGGQIYYGDNASIAQQIQNKYAPTVIGNMNSGYADESNYDSGGSYDEFGGDYGGDYYGDY